jgi:CBS domain-containing protein
LASRPEARYITAGVFFSDSIMEKWECYRCSFVIEQENPPEECPNCHYSVSFWIGHVEESRLSVKNFVRTNLLKLDANSSVLEAARLMKENDAGSVLITTNGETAGIVTERDVLYKVAATDLPASKTLLKDIMSTTIVSTTSDTPITEALKLMAKHHIRRLLVTEGGKPIGMVSQRSILGGSFRVAKDSGEGETEES